MSPSFYRGLIVAGVGLWLGTVAVLIASGTFLVVALAVCLWLMGHLGVVFAVGVTGTVLAATGAIGSVGRGEPAEPVDDDEEPPAVTELDDLLDELLNGDAMHPSAVRVPGMRSGAGR